MTKAHKFSVKLSTRQLRLLERHAKTRGDSAEATLEDVVSAGLKEFERQREKDFKQTLAGLEDAVAGRVISERQFHANMKRRLSQLRKDA